MHWASFIRPKSRFTGDSQTLCAQANNNVLKAQNMGKSSKNSVWTSVQIIAQMLPY